MEVEHTGEEQYKITDGEVSCLAQGDQMNGKSSKRSEAHLKRTEDV
jgi:hypothetical protein